ncbi:MAG: hypothetical protein J0L82_08090 [Deltaproteobacteria bacterium]|nr:hypothetical protein [Deltaproteobacteria bacterium]
MEIHKNALTIASLFLVLAFSGPIASADKCEEQFVKLETRVEPLKNQLLQFDLRDLIFQNNALAKAIKSGQSVTQIRIIKESLEEMAQMIERQAITRISARQANDGLPFLMQHFRTRISRAREHGQTFNEYSELSLELTYLFDGLVSEKIAPEINSADAKRALTLIKKRAQEVALDAADYGDRLGIVPIPLAQVLHHSGLVKLWISRSKPRGIVDEITVEDDRNLKRPAPFLAHDDGHLVELELRLNGLTRSEIDKQYLEQQRRYMALQERAVAVGLSDRTRYIMDIFIFEKVHERYKIFSSLKDSMLDTIVWDYREKPVRHSPRNTSTIAARILNDFALLSEVQFTVPEFKDRPVTINEVQEVLEFAIREGL